MQQAIREKEIINRRNIRAENRKDPESLPYQIIEGLVRFLTCSI
jgi:hypothetical protein